MIYAHTNLNTYEICPKQYYERYVTKSVVKEPQTKQQKWGNEVHSAFEKRINKGTPFPKGMPYEHFVNFGNFITHGELELGIRENGKPCGFWDSDCWLRGKLDITVYDKPTFQAALLLDVKTGKRREDPEELKIHAVLLKANKPTLVKITGSYIWLQDGQIGRAHDLSDTDASLASVHEKVDEIEHGIKMGYMPAKQGPLCPWCPVKSCEFHPEKK